MLSVQLQMAELCGRMQTLDILAKLKNESAGESEWNKAPQGFLTSCGFLTHQKENIQSEPSFGFQCLGIFPTLI